MTSEIQWYIARDGKQYGPLSDPEMGLFVQNGHLKADDLVWRAGFSDWLPAPVAFPPPFAAPPPRPAERMHAPQGAAAPRPSQTTGSAPQHGAHAPQQAARAAPSPQSASPQGASPQSASHGGAPQGAHAGAAADATGGRPAGARPGSAAQPRPSAGGPDPALRAGPATGRAVATLDDGLADDVVEDRRDRRPRGRRVAAVVAILALVVGGSWLTYQKRDAVKAAVTMLMFGTGGGATDPNAAAFIVAGGAPDAIDARLQRTALWSVVKREFPDWYGERLAETARLTAEKKPDAAVTRHLLEALVALRRKHANDALAASSSRLVTIADAFLANLKRISATSTTTCYSFISQGEASPAIVDLVQKQGGDAPLQAQVTAIFEAIAEGRKTPVKYATPDKADYDALAEQLTKLGWSQADLQLFADPRALARTSHDRVCKMVQDWFSAHIAVKDRSAQERLLIETLRPVVAG